jgi:PAS domain S-box-containing protein
MLVDEDRDALAHWYADGVSKSEVLDDAYEAARFFPDLGETGKWLRFTAAAVRNSRGMIVGAIETLEDITDREKAEEVLRESENRYRAIFENTGTATVILEEDYIISIANAEFEKLTGFTREEIENKKSWIEFVAKEDLEGMLGQHHLRRADANAALKQYEFRLVDRYGQTKDILLTIDMIAGTKRSVASLLDITDRKRAEEKYRSIFENAIEGIYQSTPDGRFLSVNPAFARIIGYDWPEEVLHTITDISRQLYANPKDRADLLRLLEEEGTVKDFETRFLRKDKSAAWVTLNVRTVRDNSGKLAYLEGTAEDITDHKILKAQLNQAQKLEAIGTLAGGIAHDFNNILAPIIGYSELSLNSVPENSRLHHNMEQILLSGNRAKELVKQILTFSRKTAQEPKPVQVSLLMKETLKFLRSSLPSTIEIRQDLDVGAIQSTVMADPTQIHRVLMNLCTNAAHAMREKGGVLSITLKNEDVESGARTEIADLEPGAYLRASVADTGHGMNEAVRQRIFDPYFTTKGPSEGTGLGLAVVYGIVKNLSGGIAVCSKAGEGTTFDVYFPRTKTIQAPAVDVPVSLPMGKGLALLVDDEKSIVDMLKHMLESLGYEVVERYSSPGALQAFKAHPESFDLVITDLTMPHMTGLALAREILTIRADTPIILCTGFSEAIDEDRIKVLGIQALLMKPISLHDLSVAVSKILAQNNPLILKAHQDKTRPVQ